MRAIYSSVLIILASSVLGKEATLEQHLKDDTELSQVSLCQSIKLWLHNHRTIRSAMKSPSMTEWVGVLRNLCPENIAKNVVVRELLCNMWNIHWPTYYTEDVLVYWINLLEMQFNSSVITVGGPPALHNSFWSSPSFFTALQPFPDAIKLYQGIDRQTWKSCIHLVMCEVGCLNNHPLFNLD